MSTWRTRLPAWRHRVTTDEVGLRLDRLLERHHPDRTRSRLKRWIDDGRVLVDDARVKAGHPLKAGERIVLREPPPPRILARPESIPLEIVHEDEHLVVVDKAAGLVVHPGAGRDSGTLVNALLGAGIALSHVGAPQRPGIVHRLDKDTSGLLVVAKDDATHVALARALAARAVSRRYWALVWGRPREDQGRITGALGRSRADRRKITVVRRGGKEASTRYRVVHRGRLVSVVWLALETGRTHQIRVHFKHLGHPVFGDPAYGGRARGAGVATGDRAAVRDALRELPRQALHACRLAFSHPHTGENLVFTSAVPRDIRRAARLLGVPEDAESIGGSEDV